MVGMGKILATDPFHLMEPKISTSLATCTVGQVHWDGMSVAEKQANTHSDTQQEGYDPKPHKSRKQSEVVNGEQETTSSAVNGVGTTGGCLDIVEQGEVGPLSAGGLKDIEDDVPLNQTGELWQLPAHMQCHTYVCVGYFVRCCKLWCSQQRNKSM